MLEAHTQSKLFEMGRLDVVDLYEWHCSSKLNYSAYFQRQYVWREKDKQELIDTIFNGYPIPAVFLCEAKTDLTTIKKTYNVLDGRQRLESIFSYIDNQFEYNGKKFGELKEEEKAIITNYSIPIVQMYISPNEVEKIKEIFTRLNKNSYSLNMIEIKSSQLVEYDFMMVCKIIAGVIEFEGIDGYVEEIKALFDNEGNEGNDGEISLKEEDISSKLSEKIKSICNNDNIDNIKYLITEDDLIFSKYEISRQVNLQHIINILGSVLQGEIINRNLTEKKIIELSELDEAVWVQGIRRLNKVNQIIKDIYLNPGLNSFWKNRSCYYSLSILFYKIYDQISPIKDDMVKILNGFYQSGSEDSQEFKRYTQERGNDKTIREKRNVILEKVFLNK